MTTKKQSKRILSVTIKRMLDDSPDTSWLGEYSNSPSSEFSIDRAHSEDCNSVLPEREEAGKKLDRIGAYIEKLAQEEQNCFGDSPELESLNSAWDELQQIADDFDNCDCGERGDMGRNEYRYFNPSFNYVNKQGNPTDGLTPEEVRKYTRQDYERMESLNQGYWCFIGIGAEASISIPSGHSQTLSSGFVFGVESDMSASDMNEVEQEQLAELRHTLLEFGFSRRAISTAFKNIQREK